LTLIWSTNNSLPKISYVKSIDVYLIFCFFMTFLSVIEYGAVSFVHRFNTRKKKKDAELLLVATRLSEMAENSPIEESIIKLEIFLRSIINQTKNG